MRYEREKDFVFKTRYPNHIHYTCLCFTVIIYSLDSTFHICFFKVLISFLFFFQHIINSVQLQLPCSPLSYQYIHPSFKSWFFHLILIHPPRPLQCNSGHSLLYSVHFHLLPFDEGS